MTPFKFTGVGRRWNYFKHNLIEQFGEVVYKIGVDAGFDCPNRDGTKGFGGCAYCSQEGSLSPNQDPTLEILGQVENGKAFIKRRYGAKKFIVYFQAFTNTYAPAATLRQRYALALNTKNGELDPDLVGLSIATRPDCVNSETIEVLQEFQEKVPLLTLELGLQSAHQNKLDWVNRQESVEDYVRAMEMLGRARIPVISHVILGFPNEGLKEMEDTVRLAEECGTDGIKLQMLHVIKGTKLAWMYLKDPFPLMSMEEYGEVIIYLVERLAPQIQIHRITGETEASKLVAPDWTRHKTKFFSWFENELVKRNTWQGKLSVHSSSQAPLENKKLESLSL